jgi:branched-chain amino acid transport system substrate-binding protein
VHTPGAVLALLFPPIAESATTRACHLVRLHLGDIHSMPVRITRRAALGGSLVAASFVASRRVRAQATKTIRIGILTDLNGPNAASNGHGSVVGTTLASEDFMNLHPDIKVEVMVADYQSKPDIASSIARDWIDRQGVDIISQVNNSAAALAICSLVQEKDRVALLTGPASSAITGKSCTPNHVHWTYDTWALGKSTGGAVVASGGSSWYFIAADYAFGHQLAEDTASFVTHAGGKVLGTIYTPFPETTDFSAFLLQAGSSGCKVVGLANSGIDTVNCVKQAHEFGITQKAKLAALLMMLPDLHGVGLATAQGLLLSEAFYWDMNDNSRAYGKRFAARMNGWMPSMIQAGDYAANWHCLKAMAALGVDKAKASGRATVAQMKAMPTDDTLFGKGSVRPDGRVLHPMYLFEVKSPAESKYAWDYYKLVQTTPPDQAFRPLAEGGCALVHA